MNIFRENFQFDYLTNVRLSLTLGINLREAYEILSECTNFIFIFLAP